MHQDDSKLAELIRECFREDSASSDSGGTLDMTGLATGDIPEGLVGLVKKLVATPEKRRNTLGQFKFTELQKGELQELVREGFPVTAAVVMLNAQAGLAAWRGQPSDLVLVGATEETVERWIEVRSEYVRKGLDPEGGTKDPLQHLLDKATEREGIKVVLGSAIAGWLCKNIPVGNVPGVLVARDLESGGGSRLLDAVFLRDQQGEFITAFLGTKSRIASSVKYIVARDDLVEHMISNAATMLAGENAERLVPLYFEWMRVLFDSVERRDSRSPAEDSCIEILTRKFPDAVAKQLAETTEVLSVIGEEDLPLLACSWKTVDLWVKVRAEGGSSTATELRAGLIEKALGDPCSAVDSAVGEWVCRKIAREDLRRLIPLVAEDGGESSWRLLELVMLRDQDGDFITRWLKTDQTRVEPAAERVLADSRLLGHVIDISPKWLDHPGADTLLPLYLALFRDFKMTSGRSRADFSGLLLTLAGKLVPVSRSAGVVKELLDKLESHGAEAWKSSQGSAVSDRTWTFLQSGKDILRDEDDGSLGSDQAKHLVLAVMRARKGKDALVELESACANLGAEGLGRAGDHVEYDPAVHKDLNGGLLPGDKVTINRKGIRFSPDLLVRADVTRREED